MAFEFKDASGKVVVPTMEQAMQALELTTNKLARLETYLIELRDTTPHRHIKDEITEVLDGMG